MKKKLLALVLALTLVIEGSGTVFADPLPQNAPVSENALEAEAPSGAEGASAWEESEKEEPEKETSKAEDLRTGVSEGEVPKAEVRPDPEETPEAGAGEGFGAVSADGALSENALSSLSEDALSPMSDEEELARALEDVPFMVSSLNEEEKEIYDRFADLKPEEADENWDADEAFFEAETEGEAKRVAKAYGAELVCFQYGIATIRFKTGSRSLSDTVLSDMYIAKHEGFEEELLKADLWPNYIDHVYEETDSGIFTADPDYSKQWYHGVMGDSAAWTASSKGKGAVVAVIDTGVDTDHPDLKGNLIGAYESVADGTSVEDEHSHGTHCLGIVGALENNIGGVGVAPEAGLISIRAANSGGGFAIADVVAGIRMATELKVNVISMSFGGNRPEIPAEKKALEDACSKGIMLVSAAGNDGNEVKSFPAAYDCVLAVGSYDEGNTLSSFSTYGEWVEIAAPGGDIYSTVLNGKFGTKSGTSMACPVVAGVAALTYASSKDLLEGRNAATSAKVRKILMETKNDTVYSYTPKGSKAHSIKGGVNPLGAVTYLRNEEKDDSKVVDVPSKPQIKTEVNAKTGAVTVSLTCEASELHYTTDGTQPNLGSKKYSSPFTLSGEGSYTINAIGVNRVAVSSGYRSIMSPVLKQTVTVKVPKKADYDDSEISVTTDFTGTVSLIPGKSVKLTGSVVPGNSSKNKISFEKTGGSDSITVNSSGVVKADKAAAAGDSATIKLGVKDCPGAKAASVTVKISSASPTDKVTSELSKEVQELWTGSLNAEMKTSLDISKSLSPKAGDSLAYSFKSSNRKAAVVDSRGVVTAVGNGNAVITATVLDGSNKSVKIKVKCLTPVTQIKLLSSVGQPDASMIGAGSSLQLKALLSGKGNLPPSVKKVTWKLKSGSADEFKVSKSGKVTCSAAALSGSTAVISCTADDEGKTGAEYTLTVRRKTNYMGVIKKTDPLIRTVGRNQYLIGFKNIYASSAVADRTIKCGEKLNVEVLDGFLNGRLGPVFAEYNSYNKRVYSQGRYVFVDDVTERMEPSDYMVSVGSSGSILVEDTDSRGSVKSISISKPGTYSVVYKAVDGSNKKFTLKLKVK